MAEPTRNRQTCGSKPSRCLESKTVCDIGRAAKPSEGSLRHVFKPTRCNRRGTELMQ